MADVTILAPGTSSAPLDYPVGNAQEIILRSLKASFDGTGAAAAFLPAVQIISPSGTVLGTYITDTSVAAGASADVSWFPGVSNATSISPGAGIPPIAALDDYVFQHANTTITGVGFSSQANLIIQGNPISVDGATRVKVEFFAPLSEISNGVPHQALGYTLWDGATVKGVIAYIEAGNAAIANVAFTQEFGGPTYGVIIDTPSAGTHTYAVYGFRNQAGADTLTCYANTFVDGSGNLGPCWYRVTAT